MWAAILAFLAPLARLAEKLLPTREQWLNDRIRNEKKREREWIDRWVDKGSPPGGTAG